MGRVILTGSPVLCPHGAFTTTQCNPAHASKTQQLAERQAHDVSQGTDRLHVCRGAHALRRFAVLGACVAGVFAVSFGPFILQGQLRQVRFQK